MEGMGILSPRKLRTELLCSNLENFLNFAKPTDSIVTFQAHFKECFMNSDWAITKTYFAWYKVGEGFFKYLYFWVICSCGNIPTLTEFLEARQYNAFENPSDWIFATKGEYSTQQVLKVCRPEEDKWEVEK